MARDAVPVRSSAVAPALTYLFGSGTCGECGAEFSMAEHVAEQY